ncbi:MULTISPECIES: DUF1294 domain-containing protein [unclassified Janthinobacterium]|uniref:DUF1294 domain-containing protein n=1 Tax=unclassified Janthinobacterium TaxID=2610881 RepID=UPI0008F516AE|nr:MULTISPECIES: DUF1294 domain-containing protein [unclassified Janthinobacterium]APA71459.1 cold-shock protein [Janthinobacterium sp. 1_2014MBL_MicDiv]MDN2712117.1 DUF1294 domain-containing protein [Janthinobacterium sp. SUN118]
MPYLAILLFAILYLLATFFFHIPVLVALVYGVLSLCCFIAYALDKAAAREGRWRTSERTLLLLGLCCGWPGAVLAQQWLRHKSGKRAFRVLFWLSVAINIAAFVYCSMHYAAPDIGTEVAPIEL